MSDNRRRVLAEVMAIDAWHQPFRNDERTSSVHVDVSFQQGRLGGNDANMPFTFKIFLKRALLTITLEAPLTLDRSTVARGIPVNGSDLSALLNAKGRAMATKNTGGVVDPNTLSDALSHNTGASELDNTKNRLNVVQQIPKILVSPKPRGASEYAWDLQPAYQEFLEGQPWHPAEEPRLYVNSLKKPLLIDPSIRVTLSCAFEDIDISDLQPKKAGLLEKIRMVAQNDISNAAAIQYLKLTLRDLDLEVSDLDNRFSDLVVAEVFAAVGK